MRSGLQLEDSDLELISRYFQESFDIVLLIKPETAREMTGQFFVRDPEGDPLTGMRPMGATFPYRGEQTGDRGRTFSPPTLRSRRLVPDFIPEVVEPSRVRAALSELPEPFIPNPEHESTRISHGTA